MDRQKLQALPRAEVHRRAHPAQHGIDDLHPGLLEKARGQQRGEATSRDAAVGVVREALPADLRGRGVADVAEEREDRNVAGGQDHAAPPGK